MLNSSEIFLLQCCAYSVNNCSIALHVYIIQYLRDVYRRKKEKKKTKQNNRKSGNSVRVIESKRCASSLLTGEIDMVELIISREFKIQHVAMDRARNEWLSGISCVSTCISYARSDRRGRIKHACPPSTVVRQLTSRWIFNSPKVWFGSWDRNNTLCIYSRPNLCILFGTELTILINLSQQIFIRV